jgi:hypothetical protein
MSNNIVNKYIKFFLYLVLCYILIMNIDIYLLKKVLKVKNRVTLHGIKSLEENKITFFTEI